MRNLSEVDGSHEPFLSLCASCKHERFSSGADAVRLECLNSINAPSAGNQDKLALLVSKKPTACTGRVESVKAKEQF